MPGRTFLLDVIPRLPASVTRLEELADNLWFSWHWPTRHLFELLDHDLWRKVGRNPKLFLRYVDQSVLDKAATDEMFLSTFRGVLADFDAYHDTPEGQRRRWLDNDTLVAYFCAEYGFHDSVPIYSGGLGILAGDHCKTASDLRLPFVAVGLLYRQGYFRQFIDAHGAQVAEYTTVRAHELPVFPVCDADGNQVVVHCPVQDRSVAVRVWRANVGRVHVYLLDTDFDLNGAPDRGVTRVLYGGDHAMRIQQEIVLGIGGVRALRALGLDPVVWHINEGHAAFSIVERVRELVERGLDFDAALEAVSAATVFTTHTPVSAGHDVFEHGLALDQLQGLVSGLGIDENRFLRLGQGAPDDAGFNMTRLAVSGARQINGVSRIHREISSHILASAWPGVPARENPVGYVTNGIHVPTFMRREWMDLLSQHVGPSWMYQLTDPNLVDAIMEIPDGRFWYVKQQVKSDMLVALRRRLEMQHRNNQQSDAHIHRMLRHLDPERPDALTIGFARRFAMYKRATLLFSDLDWLRKIVDEDEQPVVFLFAGKAHPADEAGQGLMRRVHEVANMPEFFGKVLLIEGYNMDLGGLLTAGVDVWLNNPVYPLEASGTSGMKAAISGTVNVSVLDGWWAEGYDGTNGWAIPPAPSHISSEERDRDDACTLYEILQDEVIPLYFRRDPALGHSPEWVHVCKRSMATVLPRFNSQRFVTDYVQQFYRPAASLGRKLADGHHAAARELAEWKRRVRDAWPGVALELVGEPDTELAHDGELELEVQVSLNGLEVRDVCVEAVIARGLGSELTVPLRGLAGRSRPVEGLMYLADDEALHIAPFEANAPDGDGGCRYRLAIPPPWCGGLSYEIRARPCHPLLGHPHELGLLCWVDGD